MYKAKYKPIVLIILDGWGLSPSWGGNALMMNNPRNISDLWRNYPHTVLQALGAIEYGNIVGESRLGHLMIGAGRGVTSFHSRINQEIRNRQFFKNKVLLDTFHWAQKNNSNLHLIGMISEGGVHSDVSHLLALLDMAHRLDFSDVFIDAICDGTDSGPTDALSYVEKINQKISQLKLGQFSSVSGRDYAMDRDERWDKIREYYTVLTEPQKTVAKNISEVISQNYREGKNDEFITPIQLLGKDGKAHIIKDGDAVIFFNFREDRARELTRVFVDKDFHKFLWHPKKFNNFYYATFINYQKDLPAKVAFPEKILDKNLSQVLSETGLKQLKIAESEKMAHVTYFFNGGKEEPYEMEERKIISSPNVSSYDQKPEMSAEAVSNALKNAIKSKNYDFIVVNFANVDMVAHSGNIIATGQAVQILDKIIGEVTELNLRVGGVTLITADHGNAEQMININKKIKSERETLHTLNPVPFILVAKGKRKNLISASMTPELNSLARILDARDNLADIAPTVLELAGIPKPSEMTGHSLLGNLK